MQRSKQSGNHLTPRRQVGLPARQWRRVDAYLAGRGMTWAAWVKGLMFAALEKSGISGVDK
jgi:hypothetical protein